MTLTSKQPTTNRRSATSRAYPVELHCTVEFGHFGELIFKFHTTKAEGQIALQLLRERITGISFRGIGPEVKTEIPESGQILAIGLGGRGVEKLNLTVQRI